MNTPGRLGIVDAFEAAWQRRATPEEADRLHRVQTILGVKDNDVFGSTKLYAMQLYRDTLFREAEGAGLTYWQEVLGSGAQSRAQVANAFLNSTEFQTHAGALARLYFAAFDRIPDEAGMTHWMEQLHSQGQTLEHPVQVPIQALGQTTSGHGHAMPQHGAPAQHKAGGMQH